MPRKVSTSAQLLRLYMNGDRSDQDDTALIDVVISYAIPRYAFELDFQPRCSGVEGFTSKSKLQTTFPLFETDIFHVHSESWDVMRNVFWTFLCCRATYSCTWADDYVAPGLKI